jgi:phage terminase large subunit-like protein
MPPASKTKRPSSYPEPLNPDPEKRWRPRSRTGTICGYSYGGSVCRKKGAHYCEPRADRVVRFFSVLLKHTKGPLARHAFDLEPWQEYDIIRPLFGEVVWSPQWRRYRRRYEVAGIVLGRKNGKSELVAGIALYLTIGDDEEAAEVYGAAKDTKQASKVFDPAKRMVALDPRLRKRLEENKQKRRLYDLKSESFLEVITADALGELGHNPHGFYLDEVLSQPDGSLWAAMRTAVGARLQSLLVAITTETNDPASWGSKQIDEYERIQENPSRAPHIFAYVRLTPRTDEQLDNLRRLFPDHPALPVSLDWKDERNWYWANPALGRFKNVETLRTQALEAQNDPAKENEFRQFQLNQRVSQVTRWMPLHVWDLPANIQTIDESKLAGRTCYAGLDLASTTDLAAWVLLFPPDNDTDAYQLLWRFWVPEERLPELDKHTGGLASVWAKQKLLYATEGDWIDYTGNQFGMSNGVPSIHRQIRADKKKFRIRMVGYDKAEAAATAQFMQKIGLKITPVMQGYGLSLALKEMMRLTKSQRWQHGGHPVAQWNADSAETRSNDTGLIKLVKPDRDASGKRVDGIAAAANALWVEQTTKRVTRPGAAKAVGQDDGYDVFSRQERLDL